MNLNFKKKGELFLLASVGIKIVFLEKLHCNGMSISGKTENDFTLIAFSKYLFLKVSYLQCGVAYPDIMRGVTDINSNNTFRRIKCY